MIRNRMTSVEAKNLKFDLETYVLKQKAPFCVYSLTKDYLAPKGTGLTRQEHQKIRVYFSKTVTELLNNQKLRLVKIENVEDTLPKKTYEVIK